jgi:uncharacterized membrane protein
MIRKVAWVTMTFLAISVGIYAGMSIITPAARTGFVQNLFDAALIPITMHLAGGAVAIIFGAFQVNSRLRAKFLPAHRWLGRAYLVAVVVSGVGGLILARNSDGGLVGHFGFAMLAVCWLFATLNAYRHIRAGDIITHRAWMYRSYALTLAAVTLRIYLPLFQVAGYGFDVAYPLISWIAWVPNLLIVEWFVLTRPSAKTAS